MKRDIIQSLLDEAGATRNRDVLADIYRARVVDVGPNSLIVEVTGTPDKVDSAVQVLRGFGIKEMVRTGVVAMVRGAHVPQESDKVRELTA